MKEPKKHVVDYDCHCERCGEAWPCAKRSMWLASDSHRMTVLEMSMIEAHRRIRDLDKRCGDIAEELRREKLLTKSMRIWLADLTGSDHITIKTHQNWIDASFADGSRTKLAGVRDYSVIYQNDGKTYINGELDSEELRNG